MKKACKKWSCNNRCRLGEQECAHSLMPSARCELPLCPQRSFANADKCNDALSFNHRSQNRVRLHRQPEGALRGGPA